MCTHGSLFYTLGYNPIPPDFVAQCILLWPLGARPVASRVSLCHTPIIAGAFHLRFFFNFLALQDASGFFLYQF